MKSLGKEAYEFCNRVFKFNRSLTGEGNAETIKEIEKEIGISLKRIRFETGHSVGGWKVPKTWHVREGYIKDSYGKKVVDFKNSNLHIVGYSCAVDKWMTLEELKGHIFTDKTRPHAIPYVTSYYRESWGFCMAEDDLTSLSEGSYQVFIDASFSEGHIELVEHVVEGRNPEKEILLSSYFCHPSMANNELSGPAVWLSLIKYFEKNQPEVSLRFYMGPETIGAILYLSKKIKHLKKKLIGGFVLSCIGDSRAYSVVKNMRPDSSSLRAVKSACKKSGYPLIEYPFYNRGSDERQYCSHGIDLDIVCLSRSKFGMYDEYHTSDDNMEIISPESLDDSIDWVIQCINQLSNQETLYPLNRVGEPFYQAYASDKSNVYHRSLPRAQRLIRQVYAHCWEGITKEGLIESIVMHKEFDKLEVLSAIDELVSMGLIAKR